MNDPMVAALTKWAQAAPPEVKALFATQTADVTGTKSSKSDVNYRRANDPAESCATCANFDGHGTCRVVSGNISPGYVSDLYQPSGDNSDTDIADTTSEDGADNVAG